MINTTKIKKGAIILLVLIACQTITYLTYAQHQLKHKLLPEYFATLPHHAKSIYVRDFYSADCTTGETNTYISHHLSKDTARIQTSFNVDTVVFATSTQAAYSDTTEQAYNLVYYTWAERPHWHSLFGLYAATQTEILKSDHCYIYTRKATYHWILFFWLPTFEWFESSDLPSSKP